MKNLIFFIVAISCRLPVFSQNLKPVDEGSQVKFLIKNLGITVTGNFTGLQGNIAFDPNNPAASDFKVSVDASTVSTGIGKRDRDLKKENYFDVKKYPRISFTSLKVTRGSQPSTYLISGMITIKGVSQAISFPFKVAPQKTGYLFTGEFDLNRKDFKVGGNSLILSDDLHVTLQVYANKF